MKDLAAGERLGRKFTCAPFIPHDRGSNQIIHTHVIHEWTVYNIPSCGMSSTIVQSAYQKCLELYDFVPIFLKIFWGRTPPPIPGISKGMSCTVKTYSYGLFVVVVVFLQNYPPPPFLLKSKKKKKKKRAPLFWNPGSATAWSHLWFAGVRECPLWYSIVGATMTVHQFFCILH